MDSKKLETKIRESGFTLTEFAAQIGMDRTTLWKKLRGRAVFNLREANEICRILQISDPREFFFTE